MVLIMSKFCFLILFGTLLCNWIPQDAILTPENVLSTIESLTLNNFKVFVAFYEESDLAGFNKKFIQNFMQVCENLKKKRVRFYMYMSEIPMELQRRYYMYYYTLPKVKLFIDGSHMTYNGGTSPKHIETWVLKMIKRNDD